MRHFKSVKDGLQALNRRIDVVVPFLPLTRTEQRVVADTALRHHFACYREPGVHAGDKDQRRLLGNLIIHHTDDYVKHVADHYVPMEGASSMLRVAQETDGAMNAKYLRRALGLTDAERAHVVRQKAEGGGGAGGGGGGGAICASPTIWVHHRLPDDDIVMVRDKPLPNPPDADDEGKEGKAAHDDDDGGELGGRFVDVGDDGGAGGGGGGSGGGGGGGDDIDFDHPF